MKKEIEKKKSAYGFGPIIYKSSDAFPDRISSNGLTWYKTAEEYETETGMQSFLYSAPGADPERRLFIDAAGNIWNETELGIF